MQIQAETEHVLDADFHRWLRATDSRNKSVEVRTNDLYTHASQKSSYAVNDYRNYKHWLNLQSLDQQLQALWHLGRNIILQWCPRDHGIDLLVVPFYTLATFSTIGTDQAKGIYGSSLSEEGLTRACKSFIKDLVSGTRQTSEATLIMNAETLGVDPIHIKLPDVLNDLETQGPTMDAVIRPYSISHVENRGVVLFDIVGFSLLKPFEQVTQLNSLAYSINATHSKLHDKRIHIDFALSTTGDGFYLWNRDASITGTINLYHLMHLILADNAIARSKSTTNTTPLLKTAFHIGSTYEFHQSEGLRPSTNDYLVGDVTIELARLMQSAEPGQIIVGDFSVNMPANNSIDSSAEMSTPRFIQALQGSLADIQGLVLSGERVQTIKCYLTGTRNSDGNFAISKYLIRDKHGLTRFAYNAKVNIYRKRGAPIYLGLAERVVTE